MNRTKHWYLVAYDLRCKRRLGKLHRFLRARGYPLQHSAFAWQGDVTEAKRLRDEITALIDTARDDVRVYRIHSGAAIDFWVGNPFFPGIIDFGYPPYRYRRYNQVG